MNKESKEFMFVLPGEKPLRLSYEDITELGPKLVKVLEREKWLGSGDTFFVPVTNPHASPFQKGLAEALREYDNNGTPPEGAGWWVRRGLQSEKS